MSLLRKPTDHHCRCAMIAGFPESVQGVYLIQVGRMPTFSLKSEARGLALELVFCATGVAVTSKTDTDGKLYTKSEKIEKEKARSASEGEVLSPRLDDVKVRFFGDNLAVLYGRESPIRKSKDGKEHTRRVVWTDTWLKRDGQWQIIAVQDMVAQPGAASALPAQSESALIEDLTWTEVRDAIAAGKTTAIYDVGSTEENGPHMALGKQNFRS